MKKIKFIHQYKFYNKKKLQIHIALKKKINHLCYINPVYFFSFSLFYDRINNNTNRKIAGRVLVNIMIKKKLISEKKKKKTTLRLNDVLQFLQKDLPIWFNTLKSIGIFKKFGIFTYFKYWSSKRTIILENKLQIYWKSLMVQGRGVKLWKNKIINSLEINKNKFL